MEAGWGSLIEQHLARDRSGPLSFIATVLPTLLDAQLIYFQ